MSRLALEPGPLLLVHQPVLDGTGQVGSEIKETAAHRAHDWLHEPIKLDAAVTLADLLRLLACSPQLQKIYAHLHAADFANEAARRPPADPETATAATLQNLELHLDAAAPCEPPQRLVLSGIGVPRAKGGPEHGVAVGQRISWSVKAAPLRTLLALPLRVGTDSDETGDEPAGPVVAPAAACHAGPITGIGAVGAVLLRGPLQQDAAVPSLAARLEETAQQPYRVMTPHGFFDWLDRL